MRWSLGLLAMAVAVAAQASVVVPLDAVPVGSGDRPRWRDIAENPYAVAYRESFTYADATVTLEYEPVGTTFAGRLSADGLKPHFAYQLKFTAAHDSPGMEQLGCLGRWWWEGGPLNVSDALYEAFKDDPAISSFLVFDYAVTDADGHLEVDICLDSSYHVLWRYGITGVPGVDLPGPDDGYSIETLVDPAIEPGGAYDTDYGADTVYVFGEHEHTRGNVRPLPGELAMPEGDYELTFLLTEESFHSYDLLGGLWQHALVSPSDDPIRFSITSELVPEPATSLALLAGLLPLVRRRRARR